MRARVESAVLHGFDTDRPGLPVECLGEQIRIIQEDRYTSIASLIP